MKKKVLSLSIIAIVAVCSAIIGMMIATSFKLPAIGKAANFWEEGDPKASPKVIMPSLNTLAQELTPSVVYIKTSKVIQQKDIMKKYRSPFGGGPDDPFEDFFNRFFEGMPNVPDKQEQKSLGSGFIISTDGYIITNAHVIDGAEKIVVSLTDKKDYDAKLIGKDTNTDIALIKINPEGKLPAVKLGNSDMLKIGDWVMAIGNPFGLSHTVTIGIVSAKYRIIGAGPYDQFIQTDAAINPGNSGGPLIDMKGQVVGINAAIVASGQGIGFAIPINMAKEILMELKQTGSVTRGWLGVGIQEVTPEIAKAVGLKEPKGAMVTMVYPGDPAAMAGVVKGDVIISINGTEIKDPSTLTQMIGTFKPGSKITIGVWRGKKEIKLETKLEKRTDEHIAALGKDGGDKSVPDKESKDSLGITVKNITPDLAKRLRLDDIKGAVVMDVDDKSPASGIIKKGDVIKEINYKAVDTIDDYLAAVKGLRKGDSILMLIVREGRSQYLAFEIK
jgi:serine protease Do